MPFITSFENGKRIAKLVVDYPPGSCNENKEANGHEEKNNLYHIDLIFASGIVIGAIQLYKQYHEYSEGEDSYTDLEDYVKLPEEPERLHHPSG